jgi:tryptophan 7-halogenase
VSVLRPTDVPVRDPVAQVVALPGDRLLIRHRAGLSLLAGVERDEVSALLGRVDGRRTAAEVALDARSAALLRGLAGEAVHVRRAGPVPPGEPAAGRETPEALLPLPEPFPIPGDGRRVVFLEETSYRRILESLERLGDGLRDRPTLFVTPDPDGVRIGRACLGCALLAALAPAGLRARETLAVAARLRTVRLADLAPADPVRRQAFLRRLSEVVAREAAAEGDGEGVVLVAPDGTERLLPTPRRDDCPVCGGTAGATVMEPPLHPPHPLHIGIVGGGTAGFLAALALRAKRPDVRVTLIRSPDIPVIGVGEATTPLMPQFLHADLGIGPAELFREVRPTFKLGIRFDWGGGGFPYPFGPVRTLEAATWNGDLDACSPQAVLMAAGALPVTPEEDGRMAAGFGTETAYHLDNRRLAAYLERVARLRGVEVVDARIVGVERRGGGVVGDLPEVVSLVGERGRRFVFDLYVDCSGFRSLLVGDALGSPFVDYGASLFTDRAVVGTVARASTGGRGAPMPPFTGARTLAAGWAWTIPQPEADHVGSVYSSAFAGADDAARELEAALGAPVEGLRELRFRAGRREHFWRGNAVALGNAYGFVEPLESTSLHLLIRQIGLLVRHLAASDDVKDRVNRQVGAFWDYVRWFLAIHFRFNRRLDTPFWRACREEADVSAHEELIERFREGGPLAYRDDRAFDYPDPLWGPEGIDTLLLGQGVPCRMPRPPGSEAAWRAEVSRWRRRAGRCLSQGELLASLTGSPEVLEQLEATFRDHGPAF